MIDDISRCFTSARPVATAYVETDSTDPRAGETTARRWKVMRRDLEEAGAPVETLEAMDGAVGVDPEAVAGGVTPAADNVFRQSAPDSAADHAGGAVLAVVAAGGEVLLRRFLPEPFGAGQLRVGPLPSLIPVLKARQESIAHLIVLIDRQGADVWGVDEGGERSVATEVAGEGTQLSLVNQGGWSHRRIHQRAVNRWEANAKEVAGEVADIVRTESVEVVFVAGDVYAVGFFLDALPGDVAPLVRRLETGARGPESGLAGVGEEVHRGLRTVESEATTAVLQRFREELGRGARAADGARAVVGAIQMANVETLLVADEPDDGRVAWFGPEATHIALDRDELEAMSVSGIEEAPLVDVGVRAAFGIGADVRVVPTSTVPDGIGAILRAVTRP